MSRYNIIDAHQRISTFHPPDLQPKGHYYYKKKNTKQIFNAKNNIRRTQSGCNEIFFSLPGGGWLKCVFHHGRAHKNAQWFIKWYHRYF